MKRYRGKDGKEAIWFEDDEIEQIAESELRRASLFPSEASLVVHIERFVENHLRARLDQHAALADEILGQTEFFVGEAPKVSINSRLTGSALDEDEAAPGVLGRWRATLAHEAMHILLHRQLFEFAADNLSLFDRADRAAGEESQRSLRCLKREVGFGRGSSDWREVQANKGMAALLMPRSIFAKVARTVIDAAETAAGRSLSEENTSRVVRDLAVRFSVSREATRIRLRTLKLVITPSQGSLQRP